MGQLQTEAESNIIWNCFIPTGQDTTAFHCGGLQTAELKLTLMQLYFARQNP